MTARLANITLDCDDPMRVGTFWSAVLDRPLDDTSAEYFASIGRADEARNEPAWFFAKVPEGKTTKNRMHVDLLAPDRQAEVDRLTDLGATHVTDIEEWGHHWAVLQDPEGNEFCVSAS
jgi:predicted enzyme related to lactoylglutathione lyase